MPPTRFCFPPIPCRSYHLLSFSQLQTATEQYKPGFRSVNFPCGAAEKLVTALLRSFSNLEWSHRFGKIVSSVYWYGYAGIANIQSRFLLPQESFPTLLPVLYCPCLSSVLLIAEDYHEVQANPRTCLYTFRCPLLYENHV
jgi:hypothetical protein